MRTTISGAFPVPVLIYQMGKVGSSSVWACLEACSLPVPVLHPVHVLNPVRLAQLQAHVGGEGAVEPSPDLARSHRIRKLIDDSWGVARWPVISLVRDPIGRMVASAFSTCAERPELDPGDGAEVFIQAVLEELLENSWSIDHTLNWFDQEMRPVFEIDVFDHPFTHETGYQVLEGEQADLLLIRTENLNACFSTAIEAFLGARPPALGAVNAARDKSYGRLYRVFLDKIKLPERFVREVLRSRLADHFYTEIERAAMHARWSGVNALAG